jgi:hypothetical protein
MDRRLEMHLWHDKLPHWGQGHKWTLRLVWDTPQRSLQKSDRDNLQTLVLLPEHIPSRAHERDYERRSRPLPSMRPSALWKLRPELAPTIKSRSHGISSARASNSIISSSIRSPIQELTSQHLHLVTNQSVPQIHLHISSPFNLTYTSCWTSQSRIFLVFLSSSNPQKCT